ncbi:MAG: hypothetical protein AVDCRST_MAG05-1817, partial [uncultured Rubrobacteraceae bacterium]
GLPRGGAGPLAEGRGPLQPLHRALQHVGAGAGRGRRRRRRGAVQGGPGLLAGRRRPRQRRVLHGGAGLARGQAGRSGPRGAAARRRPASARGGRGGRVHLQARPIPAGADPGHRPSAPDGEGFRGGLGPWQGDGSRAGRRVRPRRGGHRFGPGFSHFV